MPIAGLTNPPKSFLKLGQIRKGEMREMTSQSGKKYTAPVDLEYFRVTFRPDEKEIADEFLRIYGPQPTRINIRFPFKTIEEVWDANYECYSRGGLIAKAATKDDGTPYWIFYRDHENGEILVRNGSPVGMEGIEFMKKPIDVTLPVYSYKDKQNKDVEAFLEPVGRLQVVVPEIAFLKVGYLEFRPGSPKDIGAISRELAAIDMLARQAGKDISGIPMVLSRREETITKNIKGKLSQGESWLVHIEVQGMWGQKALTVLERNSQPDIVDGEVKELPYDEEWDGEAEYTAPAPKKSADPVRQPESAHQDIVDFPPVEPEMPPMPEEEPAQAPAKPEPAKEDHAGRPYPPMVLKQKYQEAVDVITKKAGDKAIDVGSREKQVVAAILTTTLNGDKLAKGEVCEFLSGQQSLGSMTPAQVRAFVYVLKIKITGEKSDFDQAPSDMAIKEIRAAHEFYKATLTDPNAK